MNITKIFLRNYRSFKEAEIDLKDLHCFVGANASGKSNILYALDLALGERSYYGRVEESDFHCFTSDDKDSLRIEVIFDQLFYKNFTFQFPTDDETKPLEFSLPIPFYGVCLEAKRREKRSEALDFPVIFNRYLIPATFAGKPYKETGTYFFNNINGTSATIGLQEKNSSDEKSWIVLGKDDSNTEWPLNDKGNKKWGRLALRKDLLYLDSHTAESLPTFIYIDENRITPEGSKSKYSTINRIFQDFQWNYRRQLRDDTNRKQVEDNYKLLKKVISENTNGITELETALNSFFQKTLGSSINVDLEYLDKYCPFLESYFSKVVNNRDIPISCSGTGFNCLLSLGVISYFQKVLKDTGKQIVIGIDEPELFLHPQARSEYFNFLRDIATSIESPIQVLITTHSTELIPLDNPKSISRLEMIDGQTNIFPKNDVLEEQIGKQTIDKHLDDIPKYRNHERIYLKENNELFFARKVIIVEGPLEKYTLRYLCELKQDFQEPKQWPTIVCAHGKGNIKHYQLICRAFSIPYFTLYDDDKGQTNKEKENNDIELSAMDGYSSAISGSFESQFGITSGSYCDSYQRVTAIDSWDNLPEGMKEPLEKISSFVVDN